MSTIPSNLRRNRRMAAVTHLRMGTVARLCMTAAVMLLLLGVAGCHDPVGPDDRDDGSYAQVLDQTFVVEGAVVVDVDDFTGNVTWRTGEPGVIRVRATRRASRLAHLERIDVRMTPYEGGLHITAKNPEHVEDVSVDFEITAPPEAVPRIDIGVGNVDYRGPLQGDCHFRTGVGSIRLRVPPDMNVMIELSAAVGAIFLAVPMDDVVSRGGHYVWGRMGSGEDGDVHADTAVGNIYLVRQ